MKKKEMVLRQKVARERERGRGVWEQWRDDVNGERKRQRKS